MLGPFSSNDGPFAGEEIEGFYHGNHGGVDAGVHEHGGALLDGVLLYEYIRMYIYINRVCVLMKGGRGAHRLAVNLHL